MYSIAIRRLDGSETRIALTPKHLDFSLEENTLTAEACWCRSALEENDHIGAYALANAFPGTGDALVVSSGCHQMQERFAAEVTGLKITPDQICIKASGEAEPVPVTLELTEDGNDTGRMSILVTAANDHEPGTLDFGDGTGSVSNPGDGISVSSHTYTDPGTYTVTFTDGADPDRTASADVTVPYTDPGPGEATSA